MEVILAEHAGFCFGVKRAVELLEQEISERGEELPIYTWGPIIHNEEVVREFAAKGVRVLESKEQLADAAGKGTVVIRAHGVPQETERQIRENGFDVIDATCPFVKRIHGIVQDAAAEGQRIIVVGDPGHPEVQGIVSRAGGPTAEKVCVVETAEEARQIGFPAGSRVTVVAQTTFHVNKFQEIVAIIKTKEYDVNIAATICSATDERQKEAAELAARVDAMLVIGGAASSNTRKLYEICRKLCPHTWFIHTPNDLPAAFPETVRRVGITAGASTPQKIIEEVISYVRSGQEFHGAGGRVIQDDPHR